VVDKVINIIPGWQGRLLSYAARLVLLKACLASIPIYLLSIIKFPKWAIEAINSQMTNFFWNDQENSHKYHLSNWYSLAQKKGTWRLGDPRPQRFKVVFTSLLGPKVPYHRQKLWKDTVDYKYQANSPNLFCCPNRQNSPFWKGVLCATKVAKMGFKWNIGIGYKVKFWEDHWFGSCSLAIQFWDLYVIVNEQGKKVSEACK
jgi:hypothetical protein